MARKVKIRNDEDKTIYELRLEDDSQNEKIKPGKIFFRFFLIIVALGVSFFVGFILHKIFV